MPRNQCSARAWRKITNPPRRPKEAETLLTSTVVTAWTVVAARSNRSANVQISSGPQPWPDGVNVVQGRLDCTPFSGGAAARFDAATKLIDWTLEWSMDGGASWLTNGGQLQGSPAGTWGKAANPYPSEELDFSTQAALPTHFRATATPRQTTNFGVSFQTIFRIQ
jgi:hypothetical protein